MIHFHQLLARADDEMLESLIGPATVRLLNLLDSDLASARQMRQLITSFRPPEELLRDPDARRQLLDLLPQGDAEELANALGHSNSNAFTALRSVSFRKNSIAERTLFRELAVVPAESKQVEALPSVEEIVPRYPLFEHQRVAARHVQSALDAAPHRVVLHMPTGSGKTRTAMHLVARELRRGEARLVIWLAYSEELCEQSADEFIKAWSHLGDRPVNIYRYWGNRSLHIEDVGDGFMVAGLAKTYQSARHGIDLITRLSDRTSFVLIDEAHQAIAESCKTVLEVLVDRNPSTKLLGLTATPGRTWNDPDKDQKLAEFFARRKVSLQVAGYKNPIDYLVDEGYLARPQFESLVYDGDGALIDSDLRTLAGALEVPDYILEKLAADDQRNLLVVHKIEQLCRTHDRIIVFAASVGHTRLIAAILRARGIDADRVTGSTPPAERSRIIAKYKGSEAGAKVLVNYGVLTTGFDAPRTSAAVIARPTKSLVLYSQMVGRATRGPRAGGNAEAVIVSVVDSSLPGFGDPSEAFRNWEDVW